MKLWKMLGLAGLAGVAATGVVVARDERRRAQMSPEQIRARLHQRLAELPDPGSEAAPEAVPAPDATAPARTGRVRRLCRQARRRGRPPGRHPRPSP